MRKTLTVFSHEVFLITSRLSFWMVILLPLASLLGYGWAARVNGRQPAGNTQAKGALAAVEKILKPEPDTRPQGYIDPGGLVRAYPKEFPMDQLVVYPDQTAARQALDAGKISAFYVIPLDYQETGMLTVYMPVYKLMGATYDAELESLINYNLLGGNEALFRMVNLPVQRIEKVSLAPPDNVIREDNSQAALVICVGVMLLFFLGIMGSSTLLLNSLTSEKQNRMIEVLMVSASPIQLLAGKIAGLGLIGLFQMLIWMSSVVAVMRLDGNAFQLPQELMLRPSFIGWGILFFVLGYLIYAAIMAGVGALVPNLREASQISTFVMLPVLIPEILAPAIISDPHGSLAVIFSLFPLTAPIMIMMRLALDEVPLWQLLLSLTLLAVTALLVIRVVAGLFRAQTIFTGKKLRLTAILDKFHAFNKD